MSEIKNKSLLYLVHLVEYIYIIYYIFDIYSCRCLAYNEVLDHFGEAPQMAEAKVSFTIMEYIFFSPGSSA